MDGSVVLICVARAGGETPVSIQEVRAVAGRGLAGDRYFLETGTFSSKPGTGRQITLIESEAIDDVPRACGIEVSYVDARRNIVTRGVALNDLVEREFRVGEVRLRGARLCHPCKVAFENPEVKQALADRGGLRADILNHGVIRTGDTIEI